MYVKNVKSHRNVVNVGHMLFILNGSSDVSIDSIDSDGIKRQLGNANESQLAPMSYPHFHEITLRLGVVQHGRPAQREDESKEEEVGVLYTTYQSIQELKKKKKKLDEKNTHGREMQHE